MVSLSKVFRITALVATLVAVVCTAQAEQNLRFQDHPLAGRIFDTTNERFLDESTLIELLSQSKLVLIGEKHDNSMHHDFERSLIDQLADNGTRVVLEMLDDSREQEVSSLTATDSPEVLKRKLDWPDRRWPWADYGPLIHVAVQRGATVAPGNLNRQLVGSLYSGDDSALGDDVRFATVDVLGADENNIILDQLYVSHCQTVPREALNPMLIIQSARDAAMADALLAKPTPNHAVLVAGGFHVRRDLGVPRHLEAKGADSNTSVVLMVEVDPGKLAANEYEAAIPTIADYIRFTPATPETDYCATLRGDKRENSH